MAHSIIDGDGLLYQAAYNVKDVESAYKKFVDKVNQLTTYSWDQDGTATIFIEGRGNWRRDVFPDYKGHRKAAQAVDPNKELRRELSDFLKQERLVISAEGLETDDLVRRKAETMRKRNQPYIVISADKDLDMVIGDHIRFNPQWKLQEYTITADDAAYNFFKQLMVGDMQDNIRSPHLLGPRTAETILKNPMNQWRDLIEAEYKKRCGSEWEHALYFTGSLVYIQESQDAMFQWRNGGTWWDKGFSGYPSCYNY